MGHGWQKKTKCNSRVISSNNGFTLIELMVVVTIIGVLASLGVGTLTEMVFKSRQAQAKSNLSQIYAGYKNFHSEWNQYFGAWPNLGLEINGDLYYRVGAGAGAGAVSPASPIDYIGPGLAAGTNSSEHNSNPALYANCGAAPGLGFPCVELLDETCSVGLGQPWFPTDCKWETHTFIICACRKDNRTGVLRRDRWSLNEKKEWSHELD